MYKRLSTIAVLLVVIGSMMSCKSSAPSGPATKDVHQVVSSELASILSDTGLTGAILIYDAQAKEMYSNDFALANKGQLPASTFKIPNSIIGLETGHLIDESTVFQWNGEFRQIEMWQRDLKLNQAYAISCVPCYQDLARRIGISRMKSTVQKLGFGEMDITPENLDEFWLMGKSRITPMQQIDFLRKLSDQTLPIKEKTYTVMKNIMKLEARSDYILYGKTGASSQDDLQNGWFVGYIERADQKFYFATNISPAVDMPTSQFRALRKRVTKAALKQLKIIS